jgi:hypothetical protein
VLSLWYYNSFHTFGKDYFALEYRLMERIATRNLPLEELADPSISGTMNPHRAVDLTSARLLLDKFLSMSLTSLLAMLVGKVECGIQYKVLRTATTIMPRDCVYQ